MDLADASLVVAAEALETQKYSRSTEMTLQRTGFVAVIGTTPFKF
jgi:hypothetical protein